MKLGHDDWVLCSSLLRNPIPQLATHVARTLLHMGPITDCKKHTTHSLLYRKSVNDCQGTEREK